MHCDAYYCREFISFMKYKYAVYIKEEAQFSVSSVIMPIWKETYQRRKCFGASLYICLVVRDPADNN